MRVSFCGTRSSSYKALRLGALLTALLLLPAAAANGAKTVIAPIFLLLSGRSPVFSEPAIQYDSAIAPKYISAGDLNDDGLVDIAVPSLDGNVVVHFNSGGDLTTTSNIAMGAATEYTHIADLDGDGYNDILAAHPPADRPGFSVLLQDSSNPGQFLAPTSYLPDSIGRSMVTGKFNNDDLVDIVIATNDSELKVMLNDGSGTFTEADNSLASSVVTGLDVADIDGDGRLDLLSTLYQINGQVVVNMGQDDDPYFGVNTILPVHQEPYQARLADMNNDGELDIIVGGVGDPDNYSSDNVTFIPGNGDGTFNTAAAVATRTGGYKSRGFVVADFDGDGRMDIAASSKGMNVDPPPAPPGGTVRVLFGTGSGAFVDQQIYNNEGKLANGFEGYQGARGMVAVDHLDGIAGSSGIDIIFALEDQNDIGVLKNINHE